VESNGSNHQPFFRLATNQTQPRASNQETPPGVARFLFDVISPKYEVMRILDQCAGKGALTKPWKGRRVIAFEIERRKDFFSCPERIDCDLVLCNPPFNSEQDSPAVYKPEQFLRRIVEVVPPKTPIAMIVPMGMRLNQNKGSKRWRWLRDTAPAITSIISLPRDIFGSVDFHCEVLLFNMPKLKPHCFLPDRYL
jgi:type I restriction enzyme M protein